MLFNVDDYYCILPLNDFELRPYPFSGWYKPFEVDGSQCHKSGTARFGNSQDVLDVYCQNVEVHYPRPARKVDVNFILLPKNFTQLFTIDITGGRGEYVWGTSEILLSFAPPVKMEHVITTKDFYSYIDTGGSVINKKLSGRFKFANIKISNSKFVSL